MESKDMKENMIFDLGKKNEALAEYFTGQSYRKVLVQSSEGKVGISNVTFEPGSRNNWHKHHEGYQILLVTDGEGWYQEERKEAQLLKVGDVIEVPAGVKHWHGATQNTWFVHLSISIGNIEWLEPVSDEWYEDL